MCNSHLTGLLGGAADKFRSGTFVFCLVAYSVINIFVKNNTWKHWRKFVYFSKVCVVFSHARIAFAKIFEVNHTIYFERPNANNFWRSRNCNTEKCQITAKRVELDVMIAKCHQGIVIIYDRVGMVKKGGIKFQCKQLERVNFNAHHRGGGQNLSMYGRHFSLTLKKLWSPPLWTIIGKTGPPFDHPQNICPPLTHK